MGVPYCIVKNKARLGTVVGRKTSAVLAFGEVRAEDKAELAKLVSAVKSNFEEKFKDAHRHWGGGIRGNKSIASELPASFGLVCKSSCLSQTLPSHLTELQARAKSLGQDPSRVSKTI